MVQLKKTSYLQILQLIRTYLGTKFGSGFLATPRPALRRVLWKGDWLLSGLFVGVFATSDTDCVGSKLKPRNSELEDSFELKSGLGNVLKPKNSLLEVELKGLCTDRFVFWALAEFSDDFSVRLIIDSSSISFSKIVISKSLSQDELLESSSDSSRRIWSSGWIFWLPDSWSCDYISAVLFPALVVRSDGVSEVDWLLIEPLVGVWFSSSSSKK